MGKRKRNSNKSKKIITELIIFLIIIFVGRFGYSLGIIQIDGLDSFFSDDLIDQNIISFSINSNTSNTIKIETENPEKSNLEVYFIDVGQADCEVIRCNGKNMIIDAGNNGDGKLVSNYLKELGITKFDYVIGTHAHEDHIGGLDNIIRDFEVENVMLPPATSNTKTYTDVLDAIESKKLKLTVPNVGDTFNLGTSTSTVMWVGNDTKELNNSSIVIRTVFGNNSFLFMGDLESSCEKNINWPQTTVLKVGHHGSNTSSSAQFLNQTKPKFAVISVGKNNDYKHPASITLDKLKKINTTFYRTDELGTITLKSDGNNIKFDFNKTNTNSK